MINNYAVEHEFEADADLASVIDYVSGWAAEKGLIFNEVIIDSEHYRIDEIPEMKVGAVESVNCLLDSVADLVMSSLEEGIKYCEKSAGFLKDFDPASGADSGLLEDIAGGYEWMAEITESTLTLLNISRDTLCGERTVSEWIDEVRGSSGKLTAIADGGPADRETIERAAEVLNVFALIFRMILKSTEMRQLIAGGVDSPETLLETLKEVRENLETELNTLEESAIAFQTGKDAEGMDKLNSFIGFVYQYNRACYQTAVMFSVDLSSIEINGISLESKNMDLLDHLSSLVQVMENNDIIGLSDILEYEIKPFLSDLDIYIDELLKRTVS